MTVTINPEFETAPGSLDDQDWGELKFQTFPPDQTYVGPPEEMDGLTEPAASWPSFVELVSQLKR